MLRDTASQSRAANTPKATSAAASISISAGAHRGPEDPSRPRAPRRRARPDAAIRPGGEVERGQDGTPERAEAVAGRAEPVGRAHLDGPLAGPVARRHGSLLGRGHDTRARRARLATHPGPRRLPGVVPADAGLRS